MFLFLCCKDQVTRDDDGGVDIEVGESYFHVVQGFLRLLILLRSNELVLHRQQTKVDDQFLFAARLKITVHELQRRGGGRRK